MSSSISTTSSNEAPKQTYEPLVPPPQDASAEREAREKRAAALGNTPKPKAPDDVEALPLSGAGAPSVPGNGSAEDRMRNRADMTQAKGSGAAFPIMKKLS